ncbi:alpha/beta fold hydrolase [Nocardia sp. NPDC057663]|uniref:alpha/beta fold hydrolase n=1 Tax=Nocardia sp. NPDC057663 TaxID=3346201 RepID=UPI003670E12A
MPRFVSRLLNRGVSNDPRFAMPVGRIAEVRSADGTRLHVEVYGPEDGFPIVLSHGISLALRVWVRQIGALSNEFRVIAYDQRGHGRSEVAPVGAYSIGTLADDLEAVLTATLRDGERAVIAGYSLGGISVAAWSERYPGSVQTRAAAAVLINTAVGDLVRETRLFAMPARLADGRVRLARTLGRFMHVPIPTPVLRATPAITGTIVGPGANYADIVFMHEMLVSTSALARAEYLQTALRLGRRYIDVANLTVPTVVIGGKWDPLTPIVHSRRLVELLPNPLELIELEGGHSAPLAHSDVVTCNIRALANAACENRGQSAL